MVVSWRGGGGRHDRRCGASPVATEAIAVYCFILMSRTEGGRKSRGQTKQGNRRAIIDSNLHQGRRDQTGWQMGTKLGGDSIQSNAGECLAAWGGLGASSGRADAVVSRGGFQRTRVEGVRINYQLNEANGGEQTTATRTTHSEELVSNTSGRVVLSIVKVVKEILSWDAVRIDVSDADRQRLETDPQGTSRTAVAGRGTGIARVWGWGEPARARCSI